MFRAAASQAVRRTNFSRGRIPAGVSQRFDFHVSGKRQDEASKDAPAKTEEKKLFQWEPIYAVPIGMCLSVPIVQWELYVFNEETLLAGAMVMFTSLIYKNFGNDFYNMLEADGKKVIEEANKTEDSILEVLQEKRRDMVMQENVVQDAKDVYALKVETYEKLNAVGKIKPQHEFKAQIERVLGMIEAEETSAQEKQKMALMVEATIAVEKELMSNKKVQQQCLDNAIAQLKGSKSTKDPVKETYLKYFKWKAGEAKTIDEKAETMDARANIVTKLNAVAANEGYFFRFDEQGKPKMVA